MTAPDLARFGMSGANVSEPPRNIADVLSRGLGVGTGVDGDPVGALLARAKRTLRALMVCREVEKLGGDPMNEEDFDMLAFDLDSAIVAAGELHTVGRRALLAALEATKGTPDPR